MMSSAQPAIAQAPNLRRRRLAALSLLVCSLLCLARSVLASDAEPEPGLLFYLSGERAFAAERAAEGTREPTFLRDVQVIEDGARGKALRCAGTQLLAYRAPGNVYAERGTLAFSWRAREPVGPTAFPIFRVGYADHSSWDMVFLRIDYDGSGFQAFVTDVNLSRVRVAYRLPKPLDPKAWQHIAFAWDETRGVALYFGGERVAAQRATVLLHAGLDQFGPHSRIISPMQVQSAYNFVRGGDIDEIRIYDRMLSDQNVAELARGVAPTDVPDAARDLSQAAWQRAWWFQHGWQREGDMPPYLSSEQTRVRKVEIHDAYDLRRWWWKGTDGIRETTWPGVYNRSRLSGRNDYFQLPDWDCYSQSGKSVTLTLPDEPYNHFEIAGSAPGTLSLTGSVDKKLFERSARQERTVHRLPGMLRGGRVRFDSTRQEEPIGEFGAYHVTPMAQSLRSATDRTYALEPVGSREAAAHESLAPLVRFIQGRYAPDERTLVIGHDVSVRAQATTGTTATARNANAGAMPRVHVLIAAPALEAGLDGLDGLVLDLPAFDVKPTHGEYFPLNVRVKDPLWPARDLLDFSFSVKPGEARRLWLDTRDRVLDGRRGLYITLSGAGADFGAAKLAGARVSLRLESRANARAEHELDRFTQLRDSYAMLVEERPRDPRFGLYARFAGDVADLLRVNPEHWLGRAYAYESDRSLPKPPFTQPVAPQGVPLWAFRQIEQLRRVKKVVLYYMDQRQIDSGEFGGGLSDDGDLTHLWPALALMGVEPEKIRRSLARELEAFYEQGLVNNGLSTIQTDELHAYEEGTQVLGQALLLEHGSPRLLERAMESARALARLSAKNAAGHRHMRSAYFSGTTFAEEEPWGWTREYAYLITHATLSLVTYNGNALARGLLIELADALVAHGRRDATGKYGLYGSVRFLTDEDAPMPVERVLSLLWAAWRWTGDSKYLAPLTEDAPRLIGAMPSASLSLPGMPRKAAWIELARAQHENDALQHVAWQASGDVSFLERLYAQQIEASALREYINTEGSMWIDRVAVPDRELQRARLGGVASIRNAYFPGHTLSWSFEPPGSAEDVAILLPRADPTAVEIVAHNLSSQPVRAALTPWDMQPGTWEIRRGVDLDRDGRADGALERRVLKLERGEPFELELEPRRDNVVSLALAAKTQPLWERPDLGIEVGDVARRGDQVTVTVHSLGAVATPPSTLSVVDAQGKTLAHVAVPSLAAPSDLMPKTTTVTVPAHAATVGRELRLEPVTPTAEITRRNNRVRL
jgi:hypothetical protein